MTKRNKISLNKFPLKFSILFSLMFSILLINVACQAETPATGTVAENIKVKAFKDHLKKDSSLILIDVRTPEEWATGIIEGAHKINIHNEQFTKQIAKFSKDKTVLVYCRSGGRSGRAMAQMNKLGFKKIYNLEGGMLAWANAGFPVTQPTSGP